MLQSLYTVASEIRSAAATSSTVYRYSGAPPTVPPRSSKVAAKSLADPGTGWTYWTRGRARVESLREVGLGWTPLDATAYRLGCKWSQVQILSPRPA